MTAELGLYGAVVEMKRIELAGEATRMRRAAAAAAMKEPRRTPILRRGLLGLAAAGLLSLGLVAGADAQDIAAAGNGGTSSAGANGGPVLVGDLSSGENAGSAIVLGDVHDGAVGLDGGDTATQTTLGVGAAGGVGITDASGGDWNVPFAAD